MGGSPTRSWKRRASAARDNNLLDAVDPNSADGIAYWATYVEEWVRMNHVRTIAPLVAAVLLALSLRVD